MSTKATMRELILRAKEGDTEAFGELYERYFTPVYRYIFLRLGNHEDAEDIAQKVFVKCFQALTRYTDQGKEPLNFFFTVARTTIIDHWRGNKESVVEDIDAFLEDAVDQKGDIEDSVEIDLALESVHLALSELTVDQREAVILRVFQGYSSKEAAEIMNKSEQAIRQLQSRGLRVLRSKLQK